MNNQQSQRDRVFNLIKLSWYQGNCYYCYRDTISDLSLIKKFTAVQRAPNLLSRDPSLSLGFFNYSGVGRSLPLNLASLSLQGVLHWVITTINIHECSEHNRWARNGAQMFSLVQGWFWPLLINLCLTWTWLGFCSISTNSSQSCFGFMLTLLNLPPDMAKFDNSCGRERTQMHNNVRKSLTLRAMQSIKSVCQICSLSGTTRTELGTQ